MATDIDTWAIKEKIVAILKTKAALFDATGADDKVRQIIAGAPNMNDIKNEDILPIIYVTNDDIIDAYHSQYVIEHIFRSMKDRNTGSWWPLFHWTDQKIQIHGLYCTIAVLLRALIHRRIKQSGVIISLKRLLKELSEIKEVINIYKSTRRSKKEKRHTVLTKMNEIQEHLVKTLGLEQQNDTS